MSSEYSGTSYTMDFGSIFRNKPAATMITSPQNQMILFDSILNIEEAKQLHKWLGFVLKSFDESPERGEA